MASSITFFTYPNAPSPAADTFPAQRVQIHQFHIVNIDAMYFGSPTDWTARILISSSGNLSGLLHYSCIADNQRAVPVINFFLWLLVISGPMLAGIVIPIINFSAIFCLSFIRVFRTANQHMPFS
ncbi:MAG: hypothetical protein ACLUOI_38515 [Eisenbergiella sp.]